MTSELTSGDAGGPTQPTASLVDLALRPLRPGGFLQLGVNLTTLTGAAALTILTYWTLNLYLTTSIDRHYQSLVLPELAKARGGNEAVEVLAQAGWVPEKREIRKWLEDSLRDGAVVQPAAHMQLLNLVERLVGSGGDRGARELTLRNLATGQRTSWWLTGVTARTVTGDVLVDRLAGTYGDGWKGMLASVSHADEKKRIVVLYADRMLAEMHGPIRELRRYNGYVQWFTIWLAWLIVLAIGLRVWRMYQVGWYWLPQLSGRGETPPGGHELAGILSDVLRQRRTNNNTDTFSRRLLRSEMTDLDKQVEHGVYGTLGFMVGLLPSLGFVGTVLGMGNALLAADGLFSARDRQRTIALITQELGFAFDTTLIALVLGIIVGTLIAGWRLWERGFLARCEEAMADRVRLETAKPG